MLESRPPFRLISYWKTLNIEETYHERLQLKRQHGSGEVVEYESFPGIVLTDTFQINERDGDMLDKIFPVNSKRVLRQKDTPIRVVMGNPPYSAKQGSTNDNNANLSYPRLDENIAKSYTVHSKATGKASLYDPYIRAFRWASDRIGEEGVVAYVSNGGWLDGNAMDGLRRCLAEEFGSIYCFNLRGNARTSGEQRRKEKGNVFGEGTRTNIAILFLVKKKGVEDKCQIRYHDIGDYLDRQQKLDTIRNLKSIGNMENLWRTIAPNRHHDWINQRNEMFLNYLPMGDKDTKQNKGALASVFASYSAGAQSNRDPWVYNFSKSVLEENMENTIAFYNGGIERYKQASKDTTDAELPDPEEFINYDSEQISWSSSLISHFKRLRTGEYKSDNIRKAVYRPFNMQHLYFDEVFIHRPAIARRFFPNPDVENLTICVSGIGSKQEFSALIVDVVPDVQFVSNGQCFPRYRYLSGAKDRQTSLIQGRPEHTRADNIPQESVARFRTHYRDNTIDADAVFYYAYGLLHSQDYKTRFAADLKKMLPRIPLAGGISDFRAFSDAGRALAEIHVGYEDVEGWDLIIREDKEKLVKDKDLDEEKHLQKLYQVKKMRFSGKAKDPDKTRINYNEYISVEGVPLEAYDYVVNGKSAIEWVMERYQVTQDKDSKIVNDPNTWSDAPRYILELLGKVVTVSMRTVEIVSSLPELDVTE